MKNDESYYSEPGKDYSFWLIVGIVGLKLLVLIYLLLEAIKDF